MAAISRQRFDDGERELLEVGERPVSIDSLASLDAYAPECALRFVHEGWMGTTKIRGRVYVFTTQAGRDALARDNKGGA